MSDDKHSKKMALLIALKGMGTPASADKPDEEATEDEDLRVASDEAFDAIKADDKDAFFDALKSFISLCENDEADDA